MVNKLDFDTKLEQDDFEGVEEEEWVRSLYMFFEFVYYEVFLQFNITCCKNTNT